MDHLSFMAITLEYAFIFQTWGISLFVDILSVIARVPRPPIISAWRSGIILVPVTVIIPVWIIRFIIRIGNSDPYAVKTMTTVNPNGASAENNQEPYWQE
jgi:hypothetical protein